MLKSFIDYRLHFTFGMSRCYRNFDI